ncbi:hypothetical protein MC885_018777 [Smutsia gigantea]|nr:hypothetical protein MC885_018777 [Smutsia gigantea]
MEKLVFSLRLMDENWGAEKRSPTFQLGDTAHLQAEVHTGSHVPLRLFVDYCVATLTPDQNSSPYHNIVDFHGCLVDGLSDASSAFKAPRPRPETLQFTVDVFHFANDSRNTLLMADPRLNGAGDKEDRERVLVPRSVDPLGPRAEESQWG